MPTITMGPNTYPLPDNDSMHTVTGKNQSVSGEESRRSFIFFYVGGLKSQPTYKFDYKIPSNLKKMEGVGGGGRLSKYISATADPESFEIPSTDAHNKIKYRNFRRGVVNVKQYLKQA